MLRPALEVADIFRDHGAAWRDANRGHVSLGQLKVMSAIERCRTAALGGHVARCENDACGHTIVAYNSCRDRHCPRCQGAASRKWLEAREAELLPVPYFHVVYTLPAELRDVAYQNKRLIYGLLMKASAETTLQIATDPQAPRRPHRHHRCAAYVGFGHDTPSARPHDRAGWRAVRRWVAMDRGQAGLPRARQRAPAPVPGQGAGPAHRGACAAPPAVLRRPRRLADKKAFKRFLAPLRCIDWVVYCKDPFGGPEQVLRYLSRYTHRVAISNRRLVAADDGGVSFRWKDYRVEGPGRWKTMTLDAHEFIRRFLIHVLPKGFHRIRHYGLFANGNRTESIAKARELLAVAPPPPTSKPAASPTADEPRVLPTPCPCCGGRMHIIEVFARGTQPRHRPTPTRAVIRIDTS